jgi:septal ring factor EnvC (AmiA/AmiB activator)
MTVGEILTLILSSGGFILAVFAVYKWFSTARLERGKMDAVTAKGYAEAADQAVETSQRALARCEKLEVRVAELENENRRLLVQVAEQDVTIKKLTRKNEELATRLMTYEDQRKDNHGSI